MKYKVGDKVIVRKDLSINCPRVVEPMVKYRGKTLTITNCSMGDYEVLENRWIWSEEALEPVIEKTNKFTKEDFKFGDIVTLRNKDQLIYTGIDTIRDNQDVGFGIASYNSQFCFEQNSDLDIMRVERYIKKQTLDKDYILKAIYERKEEVLDKEEKEYLGKVIEPFRKRIRRITKKGYDNEEWLHFVLNKKDSIEAFSLPNFDKKSMYKGMELEKEYTLEELGL